MGNSTQDHTIRGGFNMPTYGYLANKRHRAKYPERRKVERKKNYATTSGADLNRNHRALWTAWEVKQLKKWRFTDRVLHYFLGRSVQAIQMMRHKLKKEV